MSSPTQRPSQPTSLCIEIRSIADLMPDPRNARVHTKRHVQQLAKSIESFGYNCPLLIDGDNNVIAGHGRLMAVKQLGWTQVPTIRLEHLTPEQALAFKIAENRLCEVSSWDEQLLAEQLKQLSEAELNFDLDAIGFDLPDIDLRLQNLGDGDDEPEGDLGVDPGPVVTRLGDIWKLGQHRIVCGNSLEPATYDALLEGHVAAMAFVDFPFNLKATAIGSKGAIQHDDFLMAAGEMSREEFTAFLGTTMAQLKRSLRPGALIFACDDWRHTLEMGLAADAQGLELKNLCIWVKNCGGMGAFYRSQHELIFVFKSGTAKHINNIQLGRYGRNRTNVWHYDGVGSSGRKTEEGNLLALHPTCKPVALVADAILDASERGDRVLDCFLGSGTTVIAAEKTGRIGLGVDLDPKYVDVAVRRWQRLTGLDATHAETGQTFAQLTRERVSSIDAIEGVAA